MQRVPYARFRAEVERVKAVTTIEDILTAQHLDNEQQRRRLFGQIHTRFQNEDNDTLRMAIGHWIKTQR